jgi:endonuclease YncB( thermonuclease family)
MSFILKYLFRRKSREIIRWDDTKIFIPPINEGYVIKVYDGDTFTIAVKLPFKNSPLYRFNVRLRGIDAPEMKSLNPDETASAKKSQEELSKLIFNKVVRLENLSYEKYGRLLADVYTIENGGINISEYMLNKKFAVVYDGKTKKES